LRSDIQRGWFFAQQANFPKNAVILFGSAAQITNVAVTPAVFYPYGGSQTIAFDLATYQSTANTTVAILNQESLSVLRTISLGSIAAGHVQVTWDGRADNGAWVSPGYYTVTVSGADSRGNSTVGQILSTVRY
jgi:flagellar hook assembly protein FlgD